MLNLKIISLCLLCVFGAKGEHGLRNTHIDTVTSESLAGLMVEFVRKGKGQGSGQNCVDSLGRKFDYGERKLNKYETAHDCAQYCVQEDEEGSLEHMVGFNFHFEDSLCQCLYKNKQLKQGVAATAFDSLMIENDGEDKVDGVEVISGWQCYAGVGLGSSSSSAGPLAPFKKQASNNISSSSGSSSNDEEDTKRVGNEIDVDLTVDYGLGSSSSSGASRSRTSYGTPKNRGGNDGRGGNSGGASNLCDTAAECSNPELPYCKLGKSCSGTGVCGATQDSCPVLETE